ncbi:MAG TPA: YqgE/AlgH family protein [Geminicoccaceae bacterium]|nr:YqgE/AlgH family protein [Geminicoccaceae bacterium]
MRSGLLAVVMLLLSGIDPGAAQHTPIVGVVPSLAGQLLVATPELDDPNFSHAIVYMVQHDAGGAMGVVINRVLGRGPLGKLLEGLGVEEGSNSQTEISVHYGGPVQLDRGVLLHSPDYRRDHPLVIDDLAAFSFSLDALLAMAHGDGPRHSLFALGYAGWAPNQLENEIARGSWFTIAPDEALLFDDDVDSKWERALARRGIDL